MTTAVVAAAAGVLVLTGALVAAMARIPVVDDEAWFLQVISRLRRKEALYRDVFYGAGPLPVWIGLLAVRGRRRPMLALRTVGVAYFVGILVAGSWVLAGAGAPAAAHAAVWIGALAFAPPTLALETPYTRLALLSAVVAAGVVLHLDNAGPPVAFILAGLAAGVSFSAKQTIGLAATVGVGAASFVAGGVAAAGWFTFGAGLAAAACLVPLARAGTLAWYVRRSFLNKTSYLATGSMGLRSGIREALRRPFPTRAQRRLYLAVLLAAYLVLPAVLLASALALRDLVTSDQAAGARQVDAATVALAAVVFAAAIPRADFGHVRGLFPVAVLTVALAASAHPAAMDAVPAAVRLGGAVALAAVTALALAISIRRIQVSPTSHDPLDDTDCAALRERTGGRVFLLRGDASRWYLAGGLENPTPYDYPLASVFGPHGQREVIQGICDGRIGWVCWPGISSGRLRPAELEEFVSRAMVAVEETPAGALYRMPDPSTARPGPEAPRS